MICQNISKKRWDWILCRPDLYSSTRCIIPYINGLESSSLYTCNTSWRSVYYMILNKPLVRLTTVHYQSTVSMISFAQVLTVQWSNTIPCQNVQFQVRITSHNILFQQPPLSSSSHIPYTWCIPLPACCATWSTCWYGVAAHGPLVESPVSSAIFSLVLPA